MAQIRVRYRSGETDECTLHDRMDLPGLNKSVSHAFRDGGKLSFGVASEETDRVIDYGMAAVNFDDVVSWTKQQEAEEALDGLQHMRDNVLFKLLAMRHGERPSGARRVEARIGEWSDRFADTLPVLSRESMMEALRASMTLYQLLADPLLDRFGVEGSRAARAVVLDALEAGLVWTPPEPNT